MAKKRSWTTEELKHAVAQSFSFRQVIAKLRLVPAGGNYVQLQKYIDEHRLDTSHFKGQAWAKNIKFEFRPSVPLKDILIKGSRYQSFKLKERLYGAGLKEMRCELCGWAQYSVDGRLPLELDHINGDRHDNRIENLRVLCPNCHSLQPTHRGRNRKRNAGVV